MDNHEVAAILADIARLLELEGEDTYRVRAYRKAAHGVEALKGDINVYYREGRLQEIPGVGKGIGDLITELIETGRSSLYEALKKEIPSELFEVMEVPGIGRKTAIKVHKALGATTIQEFKQAAREHRIRKLKGMGESVERRILDSIERYQRMEAETRLPLYRAREVARELLEHLKGCGLERVEVVGSVRRWAPLVSDVNIICLSEEPERAIDCFISSPIVSTVELASANKVKVATRYRVPATLEVVDPESWGLHMAFDTGSEKHLEELVEYAAGLGFSLSHEGLMDAVNLEQRKIAVERHLYGALGLDYIPPELREGRGEVRAAAEHALPDLVELKDIRGDLHVHSSWSDGANSIHDIAMAARARGYEYVAICDHSPSLTVASGLSVERLREQMEEIDRLNENLEGFTILKGCEVDVMADGSLDLPDDVLEELDIVVASVHKGLRQDDIAWRVFSALENPYVTILGHPTGRIIGRREAAMVDVDRMIDLAVANGKVLEVNAYPDRLDLSDENVRKAVGAGALISINTDAHSLQELGFIEYGVYNARRGWAPKNKALNALPYESLLKYL
ncbi:DNA polymerase IV (family X) [Methanocella conradii HZ254]|uniref:DNA-directed DNA polymerase n=1 Tax=Methanocella conradii (strain DSM 24694 / JCM 17849 / CGMCC 1.5162 / HZ254) TaxID=1041930 RepID=H8I9B2_METCZ|nr:DNA polymerase/3'-5' exonuclease PolX [Methanocella conradii]AFC99530.1 DNA polymerase IV (family X) [Methanocella conradii HZ254]